MPHCTRCGAAVADQARFCQACGQAQPADTPAATSNPAPASPGLSQNTAALLSYVLGWITGIIFLLIDKRPFVRFHAAQSLVTFAGLHVVRVVLGTAFGLGWHYGGLMHGGFGMGVMLVSLIGLLTFVLWIVCMVKAYQGARFKLPIAGDIAESLTGH